jgi:hypothetical protein
VVWDVAGEGAAALGAAGRAGNDASGARGGAARDGSGRGGPDRDAPEAFDSSAAASCSGRGRDTSLARMAAFSVIFIPGIGTSTGYPFHPAATQSRNQDEIAQIPAMA